MRHLLMSRSRTIFSWSTLVVLWVTAACSSNAQPIKNGFDLSNSLVPADEIRSGGPPKDGIPALTDPEMISADEATYLDASDQVIGLNMNGEARAYPLKILVHHENVNDVVAGQPVAVTY